MSELNYLLLMYPFVVAWLWMLGGTDLPPQVDWLEGKAWRRLGTSLLLGLSAIVFGFGWFVSLLAGGIKFIATSLGYGKAIQSRDWKRVALIGISYSVPAFVLMVGSVEWERLWGLLLPPAVWTAMTYWSNIPNNKGPTWKLVEGATGLATGIAEAVVLWK